MPRFSPSTGIARGASTEEVIVSEHLAELRGRVRLLTWVSGLCWTAVVVFGGLLILGTLDWLVHFDESGTRLLIGLALLAGSGWIVWRQLVGPLRQPLSASFLASRVERRFPGLDRRFVSAVEFLEHHLDPRLGSTELQKAVVVKTLSDLEKIDVSDVVEPRAARNVTLAGLSISAIAALVVLLQPLEAVTCVQRLLFPFSNIPWPRAVELQLLRADLTPVTEKPDQPFLIARGDTLELYVQNKRGTLPARTWFEYRIGDAPVTRESLRQTTIRDDKGQSREAAIISWIATRGTMLFRVSGGDDDVMPFHRVEVVPPPIIESMQLTVEPPLYSGRAKENLSSGVGHIQGLLGTKVRANITCDKALKSAKLRIGEQPGIPLALDPSGRYFSADFEITQAGVGTYWFELTDTLGFTDHEAARYEVRGIADGVPEVAIETPVADVMLTPDAELPVKVLAKDDLGLREVRIAYQLGADEKIAMIPLFDSGSTPADLPDADSSDSLSAQQHEANYLWKMADLHLELGTRIVFQAEATDDYDLGPPHVGKSVPRTIVIVSGEEKQKELASRVGNLLDDLKQISQLQQRTRQQTEELHTQLEKVGELRSQDVDQLHRTGLDQRQATSRLTNPADGVEAQAQQLLDEFRGNRLKDSSTEDRLQQLTDEIGRLEREDLPDAERALTRAQKLAEGQFGQEQGQKVEQRAKPSEGNAKTGNEKDASESDSSPDKSSDQPATDTKNPHENKAPSATEMALAEALSKQDRALETLHELQESLSQWRDRRDVSRDLDSVMAEQQSIQKDSVEMAGRTMSKSSAELTKQDKAELNKLAARQRKIADQLDRFYKQLQQTADSLQKTDPDAAESFSGAEQELKKQATSSTLEDAAQDIIDNKMGSAVESQQRAMDELREVERMMKRRSAEDTEQFVNQATEAQQEIHQLKQDLQNLADEAQELAKQSDSPEKREQLKELKEEEDELVERMGKAERKLERLRLHGPAQATNRARERLTEMMQQLLDADDAEEMQEVTDEALDDLEQAEREIALEKRVAQERLAFEQLEKIEDELKSLRKRQESVIEETIRLETAKSELSELSRGQLRTLKDLCETERSLQHSAEQLQQKMANAEVFALVLKRLAKSLRLAADALGERETGASTQNFEKDAIRRIDSLLAVLKQDQKKPEKPSQPTEKPEELGNEPQKQEDKPEEAQPPGSSIPELAQLKLLKAMQEEYLERTAALNQLRDKDGKLPESMEKEQSELASEQAELADFASNLIARFLQQQPEQNVEEQPEPKQKEKPKDIGI